MEIDIRAAARLRGAAGAQAAVRPIVEALCRSDADMSTVRVVCDWIQYKANFRETAMARPVLAADGATELAVEAVNIVSDGVPVTWALHVCYDNRHARPSWEGHYDFLLPAVLAARVDQLVLEFAGKGLEDLRLIKEYGWPFQLGLGVIDVRTPAVETPELVAERIRRAIEYVEPSRLMVNPDGGLRHLASEVARCKLRAMVSGAVIVRTELGLPKPGDHQLTPPAPGDTSSGATGSQPTGDTNG